MSTLVPPETLRLVALLGALSAGQRALLALHWTVGEVLNGGFAQFFGNRTGVLALEALAGAQTS